jgi:signal transduction histidine kinase
MFRDIFHKIYQFGVKVANIGITPELGFHEKKKTQLLNFIVAAGIPTNIFFVINNLIHEKQVLAFINLLLLLGAFLILLINSYRKFLVARLILTFLSSVLFSTSALLFRNGGEYFLIVNLIIIIIYFNEKIFLIAISIFNCGLFIGIKIFLETDHTFFTPVSFGRVVFNMAWTLSAMMLALLFFKKEQLSYQEQIEEKNKELQRMNDTKEKLFSIISHDLRSPIGQLKNSLDLVNREYISPETFQQISAKLSSEVDRLHSTLDNLLRWSISQLQGIKAAPERIALAYLLEQKLMVFKQMAEQKNIKLVLEDVNRYVWADPDHLLLVLRNLLSNAIKYSYQNGQILIRSYAKDDRVIIEVIDKGMGMTEEVKASIFQHDNIISNTGTANEKGTGLGLKLCKEFIEKNDGEIRIESSEQKGTTFYISLPEAK